MKKLVHIISVCFVALAAVAADSSTSQVFQMRLVSDKPSSDTEQMTLVQKWHDIYNKEVVRKEVVFVDKATLLDQSDLKLAEISTNSPASAPRIRIVFTQEGARRLADVTHQYVGKRLAIIIDGQIYSAPQIHAAITSGTAEIAGSFSAEEARDFVAKINKTLHK